MVSMATRSISQDLAKFEKSWTKPQWIVPSVDSAPRRRLSRSSRVPWCRIGPGGLERLGSFVRAGEAEHLMPGGEEFLGDGGADESGRAGEEYTHIDGVVGWVCETTIRPELDREK